MSGQVPIGNAVTVGIGRERLFQVPGASLLGYDTHLPITWGLIRGEALGGSIASTGRLQKGIPDRIQGAVELTLPFRPDGLLEPVEHIMLGMTQANPEAGVYVYTATDDLVGCVDSSLFGVVGHTVEVEYGHGIKLSEMEITIGATGAIPVKLVGIQSHGTQHGVAVPDVGNTGTYALGPWIRGLVKDATAGDIWLKVESLAPLVFKVLQSVGAPSGGAWTAAATPYAVLLDADLEGAWQNLQGSDTGLDLGLWSGENKDPLEAVWPGKVADHADLAVADVFQFPLVATVPALTMLGGNRLTPAHWRTRFRTAGDTWEEIDLNSGLLKVATALDAPGGNSSRYIRKLDRTSAPRLTATLTRTFYDRFLRSRMERHGRIEMEWLFEGEQVGTGAYREGFSAFAPAMQISKSDAKIANEGRLVEAVELTAEEDPLGAPATTLTTTTTRNLTPLT